MKQKVYLFGGSSTGMSICRSTEDKHEILGFIDNDKNKEGRMLCGRPIYSPEILRFSAYDKVLISSYPGLFVMEKQLLDMGVPIEKIDNSYVLLPVKGRLSFLENLAYFFSQRNIQGAVAEGGVFQGEFSKEINRLFPDRKLYLFDTFSGFSAKDVEIEKKNNFSASFAGNLGNTTKEEVLKKLPFPENVFLCEGDFPDSLGTLEDRFCFVNLDFDLYAPTLSGLHYFYPRMVPGGVILIHDYFSDYYQGVLKAVMEYDAFQHNTLSMVPIGDNLSIAVVAKGG